MKKRNTPLLIGILVLLAALLMAVFVFYGKGNQNGSGSGETAPHHAPSETAAAVPTAGEFADGYFRVIGRYQPATAGSSLKRAQAACEALGFAVEHSLSEGDTEAMCANMLAAWESLTDEERTGFDRSFLEVCKLMDACFSNWEENRGLFDDAGVSAAMEDLLGDAGAKEDWAALASHTLTLGNSED